MAMNRSDSFSSGSGYAVHIDWDRVDSSRSSYDSALAVHIDWMSAEMFSSHSSSVSDYAIWIDRAIDSISYTGVNGIGHGDADSIGYRAADSISYTGVSGIGHGDADSIGYRAADSISYTGVSGIGHGDADSIGYRAADSISYTGVVSPVLPWTVPAVVSHFTTVSSMDPLTSSDTDSDATRVSSEEKRFLSQAQDMVSIDLDTSISSSYDADTETVLSEQLCFVPEIHGNHKIPRAVLKTNTRNQTPMDNGTPRICVTTLEEKTDKDNENRGLVCQAIRGILGSVLAILIAQCVIAIARAFDPDLSNLFSLLVCNLSHYVSSGVVLLLMAATAFRTMSTLKARVPSKWLLTVLFILTGVVFVALGGLMVAVLVKFSEA